MPESGVQMHRGSQHEADHVSIWHRRFHPRVHGSTGEEEGSEDSVSKRRWVEESLNIYLYLWSVEDVHQNRD